MKDGIALCIPTKGTCDAFFVQSVVALLAECNNAVFDGLPVVNFDLIMHVGTVIQQAREEMVLRAIEGENKYVLFLDDDMVFHPDAFKIMYQRQQPIVCTNYPKRMYPIQFVACDDKGEVITTEATTGLQEVKFTGFGMALIETEVFKKIPKPHFPTFYHEQSKLFSSEDFNFYVKAKEAGYQVLIDHDASRLIGHSGQNLFHWSQYNGEK